MYKRGKRGKVWFGKLLPYMLFPAFFYLYGHCYFTVLRLLTVIRLYGCVRLSGYTAVYGCRIYGLRLQGYEISATVKPYDRKTKHKPYNPAFPINSSRRLVTLTSLTPLSKSSERMFMSGKNCFMRFSIPFETMWLAIHPKGCRLTTLRTP